MKKIIILLALCFKLTDSYSNIEIGLLFGQNNYSPRTYSKSIFRSVDNNFYSGFCISKINTRKNILFQLDCSFSNFSFSKSNSLIVKDYSSLKNQFMFTSQKIISISEKANFKYGGGFNYASIKNYYDETNDVVTNINKQNIIGFNANFQFDIKIGKKVSLALNNNFIYDIRNSNIDFNLNYYLQQGVIVKYRFNATN